MTAQRHNTALALYLLVTFGLAWAIMLGPVRMLGLRSMNPLVLLLMVGVMFCPSLGALVARWYEGRGFGDAGLRWGRGRYHLVAWLLPFGIGLVATALTVLLGAGGLDLSGQTILDQLSPAQKSAAAAQIAALGAAFPLVVVLSMLTQGVLLTSLATFGEEFGWRGYLQVRLGHLGRVRAMVVTGLVWGIWHAPVILQGHNYPRHPVLGVPLMILWCVLLAVLFGWLFEASRSVLAPTLAHASLNSPAAGLGAFVTGVDSAVGNITGVIGMAVLGAVVLWLWRSGRLTAPLPSGAPAKDMNEDIPH